MSDSDSDPEATAANTADEYETDAVERLAEDPVRAQVMATLAIAAELRAGRAVLSELVTLLDAVLTDAAGDSIGTSLGVIASAQ